MTQDQFQTNLYTIIGKQFVRSELLAEQLQAAYKRIEELTPKQEVPEQEEV